MSSKIRIFACSLSIFTLGASLAVSHAQQPPVRPQVCISGFQDLFLSPDQWQKTRSQISSVIVADHGIDRKYTDDQLKSMFDQLNNWNLRFTLEVGAIKPWGPTGVKCFAVDSPKWDRFLRLGAHIAAIAMDEPLTCARGNLKQSDDYAVQETATFIALVRQRYPQIMIGDIETYPTIPVEDHCKWIAALNAKLTSMGVRGIDFYRLDTNWVVFDVFNRGSWRDVVKIEKYCHSVNLQFSLIYWAADYPALTRLNLAADDTWYESIFHEAYDYALVGGVPDEYCLESWISAPRQIVPETGDFTYTRSVLDFVAKFVNTRK